MDNLFKEQLPIEIRKDLLKSAAEKAFANGVSYVSIIQRFATLVYPQLIQRIEALEVSDSSDLLPLLFIQAKREYFETKEWITLNLLIYKEVAKQKELHEEKEIEELLNRQLQRINRHASKVYELACRNFPSDYADQRVKIEAELDRALIGNPEKLAIYTQEQKQIYFEKIKTTKTHLQEMTTWIVQERPKWFKWLMDEARGLNLSLKEKWPYPVIYTIHNSLYIPLEVPEHFLGIGEGKIICRTVDLDKGRILALVKPRILYALKEETEEMRAKQEHNFEFAWRESNFLMKLQGKKGIIEVVERAVFKINEKQHLFLIEEKYEESSLMNYVLNLGTVKKTFDFKTKIEIARCILQGLIHIHDANILHRDIKPHNVLIDTSDPHQIKAVICDFNVACFMDETKMIEQEGFSPVGCPPEYARGVIARNRQMIMKATTAKMDIWAMGVVLWFIFFLEPPPWLKTNEISDIFLQLIKLTPDWFPQEFQHRPFASLIKAMLSLDPNRRPYATEAYEEFERLARSE